MNEELENCCSEIIDIYENCLQTAILKGDLAKISAKDLDVPVNLNDCFNVVKTSMDADLDDTPEGYTAFDDSDHRYEKIRILEQRITVFEFFLKKCKIQNNYASIYSKITIDGMLYDFISMTNELDSLKQANDLSLDLLSNYLFLMEIDIKEKARKLLNELIPAMYAFVDDQLPGSRYNKYVGKDEIIKELSIHFPLIVESIFKTYLALQNMYSKINDDKFEDIKTEIEIIFCFLSKHQKTIFGSNNEKSTQLSQNIAQAMEQFKKIIRDHDSQTPEAKFTSQCYKKFSLQYHPDNDVLNLSYGRAGKKKTILPAEISKHIQRVNAFKVGDLYVDLPMFNDALIFLSKNIENSNQKKSNLCISLIEAWTNLFQKFSCEQNFVADFVIELLNNIKSTIEVTFVESKDSNEEDLRLLAKEFNSIKINSETKATKEKKSQPSRKKTKKNKNSQPKIAKIIEDTPLIKEEITYPVEKISLTSTKIKPAAKQSKKRKKRSKKKKTIEAQLNLNILDQTKQEEPSAELELQNISSKMEDTILTDNSTKNSSDLKIQLCFAEATQSFVHSQYIINEVKILLPDQVTNFMQSIEDLDEECSIYLRGGMIRDIIHNRPYNDADFVTNCNIDKFKKLYPQAKESMIPGLWQIRNLDGLDIDIIVKNDNLDLKHISRYVYLAEDALFADKNKNLFDPQAVFEKINNVSLTPLDCLKSFARTPEAILKTLKTASHLNKQINDSLGFAITTFGHKLSTIHLNVLVTQLNVLFNRGNAKQNFEQLLAYNLLPMMIPALGSNFQQQLDLHSDFVEYSYKNFSMIDQFPHTYPKYYFLSYLLLPLLEKIVFTDFGNSKTLSECISMCSSLFFSSYNGNTGYQNILETEIKNHLNYMWTDYINFKNQKRSEESYNLNQCLYLPVQYPPSDMYVGDSHSAPLTPVYEQRRKANHGYIEMNKAIPEFKNEDSNIRRVTSNPG